MIITDIKAYQIYDSRGLPTIACWLEIDHKFSGISMVPSGASTGSKEAIELRDNDKNWYGKGVLKAIKNINTKIKDALIGQNGLNQKKIDQIMIDLDGTSNKSNLGANAILAVSLANVKACASAQNKQLYQYIRESLLKDFDHQYNYPIPFVNVINGGAHANNNLDFQEFMFVCLKSKSWEECLKIINECFISLQTIIKNNNQSIAKGDEGGFSINFKNTDEVFELLILAIKSAGYIPGIDIGIALDIAASEFYDSIQQKYLLHINNDLKKLTTNEMIDYYLELINKYPIVSIEDPFDENDWDGFVKINQIFKGKIQIVGDDLYCTNSKLLDNGIKKNATNAILIKLNQIGTLSECIETIKLARNNKMKFIISHRSGETEDSFIADLCLAVHGEQIKTGSMSRSERLSKYNRLLTIDSLFNKLSPTNWRDIYK